MAYVALRGQPQPSGHPRPHPACPVLSQAWNNIPVKVLTDAGHLGCLQSLHPKIQGPATS